MELINQISGNFKVIQSTSNKLIGCNINGIINVGEKYNLYKNNKEFKEILIETIIKIDNNKFHILNSNIGIIIKSY